MVVSKEDIVISGIGGFFPNALNIEEWRQHLFNNEIHLEEKWPKDQEESNLCGAIPGNQFDHSFFGIHRQLTTYMDPLTRMALERTFEALVDAGVNPNYVRGKKIGCFVGSSSDEVSSLFIENVKGGYGILGHARCMLANRISYWLNIKGPSLAYDANWLTGFEVIRTAVETISRGECDGALVGAGNLIIFPEYQTTLKEIGMLSLDGSTKAFDFNSCGFTRSDGVVMLFIQKASDAKRSYGSIVHLKSQFYGNDNNTLLSINNANMVEFLEEFYTTSPVKPEEIDYVETNGCGIKDTDKAEIDAIESVYCKNRKTPLLIGSVKTHSGHSECCSSLFSLVKVLIAMDAEMMPATLQLETPNPDIEGLHNGNIKVVTKNINWNSEYAAVNAIGANNYYGHVVIRRNPLKREQIKTDIPALLPISSRTEDNIGNVLSVLKQKPNDREYHRLIQDVFSETIPAHMFRGYVLCGEEIKTNHLYQEGVKRQVWFVYSGMGSQWNGMMTDLMKFPIVAESIMNSHKILSSHGVDLMNILTSDDMTTFDNILNCFVGIAAMQIALTDLLRTLEIVPDGIIGHSVGELGCAYADGCLTAQEMLLAAYYRVQSSLEANLIKGMMAAIGQGYQQIKDKLPAGIEVDCHNGSDSCTLSGPAESMKKFVKELTDAGVFARLVNVANIAYHSQYIKPIGPLLHKYLTNLLPAPKLRSKKWISTSNKVDNWNTDLAKYSSAEYHTNNLLSSVYFEEGCKFIPKDAILIEIAPHGLLQAILKRSFKSGTSIPLTKRKCQNGAEYLLQNLGTLYLNGVDFKLANIYPKIDFPVSRGTPTLSNVVGWNYTDKWPIAIAKCSKMKYGYINQKMISEYVGYNIENDANLPVHFYLRMIYDLLKTTEETLLFQNLHFRKHVCLPRDGTRLFYATLQHGTGDFEFGFENDIILTGKVTFSDIEEKFATVEEIDLNSITQMNGDEFYAEMINRGHKYGEAEQILKNLITTRTESKSEIVPKYEWWMMIEGLVQQQSFTEGEKYQNVQMPKFIGQILIHTAELGEQDRNMFGYYHFYTKMLTAPGVQIQNMEMMPWELKDTSIYVDTLENIPLDGHSFQSIEEALEFAVQITLQNFNKQGLDSVLITYWAVKNEKLMDPLKKTVTTLPHLNVTLSVVKSTKQIFERQMTPQLVVVNDEAAEDVLKFIASSSAFVFTRRTESVTAYPGTIEVASFEVQSKNYSIIRKINNSEVLTMDVGDASMDSCDLKKSKWGSQLTKLATDPINKNKRIFVTTSLVPIEGFHNFVKNLKTQPNMQNVHFVYKQKNLKVDLKPIILKNLTFSFIKNGTLYATIPLSNNRRIDHMDTPKNKNVQKDCIKYLSVNPKDETLNVPIDENDYIGNFDYSGFDSNGKRIMGLSEMQEDSSQLKIDPDFLWEVPDKWSLQEAATVPHAYINAYYMLVVQGNLDIGHTVVINGGCTSIGLAAISIAKSYNCRIYVTVETFTQKQYLISRMLLGKDLLNKDNVIVTKDSSFYIPIRLATNGNGAHIVLNCYPQDHIQNSLNCCGYNGQLYHYGEYDTRTGSNIYMKMFLKGITFHSLLPKNVVTFDKEVKEEIWNLISRGIKSGVVKPLKWGMASHLDAYSIISTLKQGKHIGKIITETEEQFSNNIVPKTAFQNFTCFSENSYVVCGNSETCWKVVDWLVYRGAKTVVISTDAKFNQKKTTRKLLLLNKYFNARVITEENVLSSKDAASSVFLKITRNLGPIHAVFLLPSNGDDFKRIINANILAVDEALRQTNLNGVLINFIPTVAGIYEIRTNAGFETYNIDIASEKIGNGLKTLVDIFPSGSCYAMLHKNKAYHHRIAGPHIVLPKLDEIIKNQKQYSDEPKMIQVITEGSLKYREVAPIFIIKGLTGDSQIEEMTRNLLYPAYCTVLPDKAWPIEKLAKFYTQKIIQIYPKNVYNLVSVSTGGALTMEIARELNAQRKDVKLHLFFIDSVPTTIQKEIHQLGENIDFEINILRTIFHVHDLQTINEITSLSNWQQRVEYCINLYEKTDRNRGLLENGLLNLKNWIEIFKNYNQQVIPISGKVHLIRSDTMNPNDDCELSRYLQQQPIIKLINGDQFDLINHKDTIGYINFFVDV